MPTLRQMAGFTAGLYRDVTSGRAYRRDDLLEQVPDDVLSRPILLEREERGIYRIRVQGDGGEFLLLSRRSRPRHT